MEAFDVSGSGGVRAGRTGRGNPLLVDVIDAGEFNDRDVEPPPQGDGPSGSARRTPGESASEQRAPAETASSAAPAHGAVCTIGMCPICTLVTAFGDVRPELTEHLLLAGREILLALKVMIDARLQNEERPGPQAQAGGLEHISID